MRGLFVLFEGVDRCGKTTQARRLVETLNGAGQKAVFMRFPGVCRAKDSGAPSRESRWHIIDIPPFVLRSADRETAIGTMINSYLTKATEMDDHGVHLLFAANRWEKKCVLEQAGQGALARQHVFARALSFLTRACRDPCLLSPRTVCAACVFGVCAPLQSRHPRRAQGGHPRCDGPIRILGGRILVR